MNPTKPQPNPAQDRRPRGFASASASPPPNRREREKEKERTKLRERHRRAITSRMLAGLRQHGNFPLPARADMNDVLAALAREAGWIVEVDGSTYRPVTQGAAAAPNQMVNYGVQSIESPISSSSLQNCAMRASLESHLPLISIEDGLSPVSLDSVVAGTDSKRIKFGNTIDSPDFVEEDQMMQESTLCEDDFRETPYIPIYATLSAGIINNYSQVLDSEPVKQELRRLKSLNVDGVIITCWWGIVEGRAPQNYDWSVYKELFSILKEFHLKIQVVLAFHEYNGTDLSIGLPKWIMEIGKENRDIFFTDREGRRNTECLSWGVDRVRALNACTALEVYFDFMRSFRTEFDELFNEGLISGVEIGMGPNGELRFPSFPQKLGWRFPGIGEFQCYDKYMQENLRNSAKLRGHAIWGRGPGNTGYYNSRAHETGFFCEKGDYNSHYGRFFLDWYSKHLIERTDLILALAALAFDGTQIIVKIPTIYWGYKSLSHAPELTAGFYNSANRDGYTPVLEVLKKHNVTVKLALCDGPRFSDDDADMALSDSKGLCWQVLSCAKDLGLTVAAEASFPCSSRETYSWIVGTSKPKSDPDRWFLSSFSYQDLSSDFMRATDNEDDEYLYQLNKFIKCMHGL
ncbi:hypothetical protein LUZ60_009499 [Juncus effusus]|nr:hypothetical protein LUZ60_009499 [Juncus effusus]